MIWNKKQLLLEDGMSFDVLDTVDQDTSAIAFYFTDSAFEQSRERITDLAHCLAEKHVAVMAFQTPAVFSQQAGKAEPEDISFMKEIVKALSAFYKKYRSWFLFYAEGYPVEIIYADLTHRGRYSSRWESDTLDALKYCLVRDKPQEEIEPMHDYRHRMYGGWLCQEKGMVYYERYPAFDRVSFVSENLPTEAISTYFFDALRPAKKNAWDLILENGIDNADCWDFSYERRFFGDEGDEKPEAIDLLISMAADFEGCGIAAATLHSLLTDIGLDEYETSVNMVQDIFPDRLRIWPKNLFWLALAADCGYTPARTALFNEHLNLREMESLLPGFLEEISGGHSYAAILAGLAAESGAIHHKGEVYFQPPCDEDVDLAWSFYKQAASMGDPEGWYRLGRLAEYSKHLPDDAFVFYRKAADDNFLPALIKVTEYLEKLSEDCEEKGELLFLYDEIAKIEKIRPLLMRMAFCNERAGKLEESAEAYEMAIGCDDPFLAEQDWMYEVWNDRVHGVILPEDEDAEDEKEAYFNLGRLLMENPSIRRISDWTPAECFREAAEEIVDRMEAWREDEEAESVYTGISASTDAAKAIYYYGLCQLKGEIRSKGMTQTAICFKAAASFGVEEAVPYAAFFDEAEAFLQEALKQFPEGDAPEEMRRREAGYRLQLLNMMGLPEFVKKAYLENGFRCILGDCGIYMAEEPEDEWYQEITKQISRMEYGHDASVYLALAADGIPVNVSLFYVSSYVSDWAFERDQLISFEPYVYVFGTGLYADAVCTEVGPIGISIREECLERIW